MKGVGGQAVFENQLIFGDPFLEKCVVKRFVGNHSRHLSFLPYGSIFNLLNMLNILNIISE